MKKVGSNSSHNINQSTFSTTYHKIKIVEEDFVELL
ncbi:unnamed protein product [Spirodela intermedia]|uniref:Uncharacterized protein n=2 Tax=Spirodela intermedia TaxID=51605 RepID=A0A7I8KW04_SPIIN|nr:unnamed protein product [Spirodela intermedia]CAA6665246.1 unnamed protein product [Spirodela intermedia]CAA7401979.1 unnamed protein product [Spirodela intermedia]